MMRFFHILFLSLITSGLVAQEQQAQTVEAEHTRYARKIIDRLASDNFYGRGYIKDGHKKAAKFIKNEFTNIGLTPFTGSFEQFYDIKVNTFPDHVGFYVGEKRLKTGEDFIVHASCPTYNRAHEVVKIKKLPKKPSKKYTDKLVVVDESLINNAEDKASARSAVYNNIFGASGVVIAREKNLTHSFDQSQKDYPIIEVLKSKLPLIYNRMHIVVDAELKDVKAENVLGYVPGTEVSDSFIVFTAHYDHLGMMGSDVMFPGANDNASGTAMLLSLARYFKEHPARYSVAFIAFGAEEVGLLGSKYYVEHPKFSLSKIRFLTNLDIFGTGDDGIQIVNSTIYEKEYQMLANINERNKMLIPQIKTRGQAANSDHHPFHQKGVPSFFIYTLGGIAHYHNIHDKAETLPLTEFEDIFRLLAIFVGELSGER